MNPLCRAFTSMLIVALMLTSASVGAEDDAVGAPDGAVEADPLPGLGDPPPEGGNSHPREPPLNAVFVHPYSFFRRALVASYERGVPLLGVSGIVRLSFGRRARADYRSTSFGIGAGWRWYFVGEGAFTDFSWDALVGPFLGGRTSFRWTWLRANGSRVGRAVRMTLEGSVGWRFVVAGHLEISPYAAFGLHTDFIEGLARQLRPSGSFGLTTGAVF